MKMMTKTTLYCGEMIVKNGCQKCNQNHRILFSIILQFVPVVNAVQVKEHVNLGFCLRKGCSLQVFFFLSKGYFCQGKENLEMRMGVYRIAPKQAGVESGKKEG